MTARTCRVCGTDLPYTSGKGRPPVLCPSCRKDADAARHRVYRQAHKDELAAKDRARYQARGGKTAAQALAYYKQNKPNLRADVTALLVIRSCTELEIVDALSFPPRAITAEIDRLYESGEVDFDPDTGKYRASAAA